MGVFYFKGFVGYVFFEFTFKSFSDFLTQPRLLPVSFQNLPFSLIDIRQ